MAKPYTVFVDDNFHYMDESERYKLGEFADCASAMAACKQIVDEFLDTCDANKTDAEILPPIRFFRRGSLDQQRLTPNANFPPGTTRGNGRKNLPRNDSRRCYASDAFPHIKPIQPIPITTPSN